MNAELIEKMARVMCWKSTIKASLTDDLSDEDRAWVDFNWSRHVPTAQAALQAIKDAGYVIVPKEPTEAMIKAGSEAFDGYWSEDHQAGLIYRSMLTASQREGDGK